MSQQDPIKLPLPPGKTLLITPGGKLYVTDTKPPGVTRVGTVKNEKRSK